MNTEGSKTQGKLVIIWSSRDIDVAENLVFMYAKNSKLKEWWDQVRLVVWGPSAQLLAGNEDLQDGIEELKAAGVELQACKACSDRYGVSDKLASLGIEVLYMGAPLTAYLKEGWATLTF